jgi:hypothetical protein
VAWKDLLEISELRNFGEPVSTPAYQAYSIVEGWKSYTGVVPNREDIAD